MSLTNRSLFLGALTRSVWNGWDCNAIQDGIKIGLFCYSPGMAARNRPTSGMDSAEVVAVGVVD